MPATMLSRIERSKRIAEWWANAAHAGTSRSAASAMGLVMLNPPAKESSTGLALLLAQAFEVLFPGRLVALVRQQPDSGLELPLLLGRDRLRVERGIRHRHLRRQHLGAVVVHGERVLLDDLRLIAV